VATGITDVDDGADAEGDVVGSGAAHPAAPDKIDKIRRIAPERMRIVSPAEEISFDSITIPGCCVAFFKPHDLNRKNSVHAAQVARRILDNPTF
jgi:hypothetical protein